MPDALPIRIVRTWQGAAGAALLIAGADRCLQRVGRATCLAADQIPRLVRRNGEQPRPEPSLRIELLGRLVDLQERFLKYIFGSRAVAEEAHEEVKQLTLIPVDERGKALAIPGAVVRQ